jgi:hypothetical protein
MAQTMIRKQVYLEQAQDQKLKRLASQRGCTEAELVREAIDQLPDPEGDWIQRLMAAGVLMRRPPMTSRTREMLESLEHDLDDLRQSLPPNLTLSDAIVAERQEGW